MSVLLLGAGIVLIGLTTYDFLYSTISLRGLGPLSGRLAGRIWRLSAFLVTRTPGAVARRVAVGIGPLLLIVISGMWIAGLWAGFTMVFLSGGALVDPSSEGPASVLDAIGYTSSAFSTLGSATVIPTGGWWMVLTTLAAIAGLVVLTLAVSFLVAVTNTTAETRAFAMRVAAIHEMRGRIDDATLLDALADLGPDLATLAVRLHAVPIAGYFGSPDPATNFPVAVCRLADLVDRLDGREDPTTADEARLSALYLALIRIAPARDDADPDPEAQAEASEAADRSSEDGASPTRHALRRRMDLNLARRWGQARILRPGQ